MRTLYAVICRNIKMFFKDKGMFFTSLITPLILLLLFITFLGSVYRGIVLDAIPASAGVPESVIDGLVGGWLFSSLLAVSCVTVAFCSNLLMVQDKALGTINDLTIAPVSKPTLALGYYVSTALSTLIICLVALGAGCLYLASVGWYMSLSDVLLTLGDVFLLVMFGTAFSSLLSFFMTTQGQMSAVGAIVSAAYGFVCGAYMPISQFSEGIRNFIACLPGTYGTALLRNHMLGGALRELSAKRVPEPAITALRQVFDSDLYFFGTKVEVPMLYAVLGGAIAVLLIVYVLLNVFKRARR